MYRGIVFNDPPTTEIAPTTLELEEGLPKKKVSSQAFGEESSGSDL